MGLSLLSAYLTSETISRLLARAMIVKNSVQSLFLVFWGSISALEVLFLLSIAFP